MLGVQKAPFLSAATSPRRSAPVGRCFLPVFTGLHPSRLVPAADFVHPPDPAEVSSMPLGRGLFPIGGRPLAAPSALALLLVVFGVWADVNRTTCSRVPYI